MDLNAPQWWLRAALSSVSLCGGPDWYLVLGHEHVLGDVDEQLLLLEHLDAVLGRHLREALLSEWRQVCLQCMTTAQPDQESNTVRKR